jgi:hypothetical protein
LALASRLTDDRSDITLLPMADTIEKRMQDLEQIIAHLPEDLDARFAGVDAKLAAIREVLALQAIRFSKLETRLDALERNLGGKLDEILKRLPPAP